MNLKHPIQTIKLALVGNPNVGKSLVFNYLTGSYADVSNYPGTTIELSSAPLKPSSKRLLKSEDKNIRLVNFHITDTPGVYGISTFNDEEKTTRALVLNSDLIVNVVSAISLDRDLFLTRQLADMGKPILVLLNQLDEAVKRKLEIDTKTLSRELNLKILSSVALTGEGLEELSQAIENSQSIESLFKIGVLTNDIEPYVYKFTEKVLSRSEALLLAEGDEILAKENQIELPKDYQDTREKIYKIRRAEVDRLVALSQFKSGFSKRDFFGRLLLNPYFGGIFGALTLYFFLYQFLGNFVAGTIVDALEKGIFQNYYEPWIRNLIKSFSSNETIFTFLAGDYGVLTLTVTYLYGLLLPLVFGFYFGLALLEDSGYLPRLAVLVDGFLSKLGMNGRAIVPLILGGGCVTMATVTTRLLNSDKAKLITMALLGITIPCSAQLGVIQGLLSRGAGFEAWLIWGGTLLFVFSGLGLLMNKLIPGKADVFISDLPPMRIPKLTNILKKSRSRTSVFMQEATIPFFIASAIVAGMQVLGILKWLIDFSGPLFEKILLLPKEVAISFILGMIRRDFGAFGLLDLDLSEAQIITACVVLTLFVPCIATLAVMIKEKNFKVAISIWLSAWLIALVFGAILARLLSFFMI
jgi:ferrous iron transport protein B